MTIPWPCRAIAAAALLTAAVSANASAQYLKRIPLDNHATLGTTVTTDTRARTEGGASIRVTTRWPTVINLDEDSHVRAPAGGDLVFQANLRAQGLVGTAYLEMWCLFPDGGRYFSRGLNSTVTGTAEWTPVQTAFHLPAGQLPSRVTMNLVINGAGTVWIDEARLRAIRSR